MSLLSFMKFGLCVRGGYRQGWASWAAARRLENCQTLSRGAWLPLLLVVA